VCNGKFAPPVPLPRDFFLPGIDFGLLFEENKKGRKKRERGKIKLRLGKIKGNWEEK
jgi:hypothetical protein